MLSSLNSALGCAKTAWHRNWSATWGWTKVAAGSVTALVPAVGHVLNDSRVNSYIDQLHLDPKVGLGLAALGVITLISVDHA